MKPDVIIMQDVHTFYGASHILHGMNLRLPEGACMSLMGRNGMGKTTTLKTIMGLVAPKQGSVTIKGQAAAGMCRIPSPRRGSPTCRRGARFSQT